LQGGIRAAAGSTDCISAEFDYNPEYPEIEDMNMVRVSATEFSKEVGRYQDMALTQPVVVTRNGRDRTVMISADEYQRLKRRDRTVFASGELPEAIVEAIAKTEMDSRHDHLNELIEDWTP
jgi:PHD/YefM family antitoxin component YafN of YafNO toxin-antitoxin module